MNDLYQSKDKQICPFLLTQDGIKFEGTKLAGRTIYFQFSPRAKCEQLVNDYISRQAPMVQPKILLDAVESYRDVIFKNKINLSRKGSDR